MEEIIIWIIVLIPAILFVGLVLYFTIYSFVILANLFYHLFTGENLKIYERMSENNDIGGFVIFPFWGFWR